MSARLLIALVAVARGRRAAWVIALDALRHTL